jgi:hypothetical protein
MTFLSDTALTGLAVVLMAAALFLASHLRRRQAPPPAQSNTWDNAKVQRFFAEIAADEKLFGIERPEQAVDEARKAGRLGEVEAMLASSDYKAGNAHQAARRRLGSADSAGCKRDLERK